MNDADGVLDQGWNRHSAYLHWKPRNSRLACAKNNHPHSGHADATSRAGGKAGQVKGYSPQVDRCRLDAGRSHETTNQATG